MSALAQDIVQTMLHAPVNDGRSIAESAVASTEALAAGTATVTDPFTVLAHAARGNVEAMRHLADEAMRGVLAGVDATPLLTLHEGLMLARMAAAVSGDAEDHMQVAFMLAACADLAEPESAATYAGEIIARLEIVADTDSPFAEDAATILANRLADETPETLALAKEYRRLILEAKDIN